MGANDAPPHPTPNKKRKKAILLPFHIGRRRGAGPLATRPPGGRNSLSLPPYGRFTTITVPFVPPSTSWLAALL